MSDHDHDEHDDGAGDRIPMLALMPMDSVRLTELVMWVRLAKAYVEESPDRAKLALQGMIPDGLSVVVETSDILLTKERLTGFITGLEEVLHELRVAQAESELKVITNKNQLN